MAESSVRPALVLMLCVCMFPVSLRRGCLLCQSASLFDVSHMGQLRIWGEKRVEFLESVVVGDIAALEVNQMRLSVMTNEQGGIIDDCMVMRKQDHIYMVINAGCKEKDLKHLAAKLREFNAKNNADVRIEEFSKEWSVAARMRTSDSNGEHP
jgi:glycine cleavage system aminomethyltransferase T